MDIDQAIHSVGDFGRGQILIFLAVCVMAQMIPSWIIFGITFLGAFPDHFCKLPLDAPIEDNIPLVKTDGEYLYDRCTQYAYPGNLNNLTVPCQNGWTFSEKPFGTTIVTEWDLVCDRSELVALTQSILMVGTMVGSVIFGHLSDRMGRRPVLMTSLFFQGCLGVVLSFSPNYWFFLLVRFFMGSLDQGYQLPGFSFVSEMFTPRKRPIGFTIFISFWGLGIMSLAVLAFLIRNWRYLQIAISLPFVLVVFICWFVPESPRWLVSIGKYPEASAILNKLARFNGSKIDPVVLIPKRFVDYGIDSKSFVECEPKETDEHDKEQSEGTHRDAVTTLSLQVARKEVKNSKDDADKFLKPRKDQSFSFLYLFKTRRMFLVTIVVCFTWFSISFAYHGVSLNSVRLAGNPYINLFLSGAIEIPANFVAMTLSVRFGRRRPMCVLLIVSSIVCVTTAFIPRQSASGVDLTAAIATSAVIGKFFVATSYAVVTLYASEVFPTVVRSKGMGVALMSARVGSTLAPFVIFMDEIYHSMPTTTFGIVAALPSLAVLLLPETNLRSQPDTVEDIDLMFEERKLKMKMKKTRRDNNGSPT